MEISVSILFGRSHGERLSKRKQEVNNFSILFAIYRSQRHK